MNMFLDEMAKEAKNIITTICDEQCTMSDKVCILYFSQLCLNTKPKLVNELIQELYI